MIRVIIRTPDPSLYAQAASMARRHARHMSPGETFAAQMEDGVVWCLQRRLGSVTVRQIVNGVAA